MNSRMFSDMYKRTIFSKQNLGSTDSVGKIKEFKLKNTAKFSKIYFTDTVTQWIQKEGLKNKNFTAK